MNDLVGSNLEGSAAGQGTGEDAREVGINGSFRDLRRLPQERGLPQGATNSVAQFVRVVVKILRDWIPHVALPYQDDVGVKGARTRYNDEEIPKLPGVRRFMMEHIQHLDKLLADIERSGTTVAEDKSRFVWVD